VRARLLRTLSLVLLASLAGCVKAYQPPALNEPHALLKLRRVFHAPPGMWRQSSIYIGDERLMEQSEPNRPAPAAHSATRVRPGAVKVTFDNTFWHSEMRWVSETYLESVPYSALESYSETVHHGCPPSSMVCSRQETRTRSVTRTRTETKTRMVWKPVDVLDDACQRFIVRAFEPGHVYSMQYTYTGASRCSIVCLEQFRTETPPGSAYRPCLVP
jgi:hypothetical protein